MECTRKKVGVGTRWRASPLNTSILRENKKPSDSFDRDDLLILAHFASKAFDWIIEQNQPAMA